MNNKAILATTTVVVLALAFSAVGYAALSYTATVTVEDNTLSAEYLTVDLDSFTPMTGVYTVDTVNNGTTITLSNLEKDGSAASMYTTKYFSYSDGAFSLVNSVDGYAASEIGTVAVTIRQPTTATADNVSLAISGMAATVNQYGFSLVYVKDDAVVNPSTPITNIDVSSGSATVTLTAYVVYSLSVPKASIASIGAFSLSDADFSFVATATSA